MKEKLMTQEDWYALHSLIVATETCTSDNLPCILLKELKALVPFSHSHCFFVSNRPYEANTKESFHYYSPDIPKEHMVAYVEKYINIDFINWFSGSSDLNAYRESDIIPPHIRCNTKFFKEWLEPMNLYYGTIIMLRKGDVKYMEFYLYRSYDEGDFSDREVEILEHISYYLSCKLSVQYPNGLDFEDLSISRNFPSDVINSLTHREQEILKTILGGTLRRDLADTLFISESTLNKHFANIYQKLNCHSYEELMKKISN